MCTPDHHHRCFTKTKDSMGLATKNSPMCLMRLWRCQPFNGRRNACLLASASVRILWLWVAAVVRTESSIEGAAAPIESHSSCRRGRVMADAASALAIESEGSDSAAKSAEVPGKKAAPGPRPRRAFGPPTSIFYKNSGLMWRGI